MTLFLPCIIVSFAFTLGTLGRDLAVEYNAGLRLVRQLGSDRTRLSDSISMTGDVITPQGGCVTARGFHLMPGKQHAHRGSQSAPMSPYSLSLSLSLSLCLSPPPHTHVKQRTRYANEISSYTGENILRRFLDSGVFF